MNTRHQDIGEKEKWLNAWRKITSIILYGLKIEKEKLQMSECHLMTERSSEDEKVSATLSETRAVTLDFLSHYKLSTLTCCKSPKFCENLFSR